MHNHQFVTNFITTYYTPRKGTNCVKWDGMIVSKLFEKNDLLPLWVADMDFAIAPPITQALGQRIDHAVYGYALVPESYYQAYIIWHHKYLGINYEKDWLRFSPSVVQTIYNVIHAVTRIQEAVVILSPVYFPFAQAIQNTKRRLVEVALVERENSFQIDLEEFEQAIIKNNVKLFILCSPHNPIGRVWTIVELEQLFAICDKHNVIILADEIHQDFVYTPYIQTPAMNIAGGRYRDRLIVANSASKSFNIASLNHSVVVISDIKLQQMYDAYVTSNFNFSPNLFGYLATEAAYTYARDWLEQVKVVIQYNYQFLKDKLAEIDPTIIVYPLEGTYLTFVNLNPLLIKLNITCRELIQDKCRLAVDFGEWFGQGYEGYIRINLATATNIISLAIDRIRSVVSSIQ